MCRAAVCAVFLACAGCCHDACGSTSSGAVQPGPAGLSDEKIKYHLGEADRLYKSRNWRLALNHYAFVLADLAPAMQQAVQSRIDECRSRMAAAGKRTAAPVPPTASGVRREAVGGGIEISYDQAMGFLGDVIVMESAAPVDGQQRYGGFNHDRSVTIELCGPKDDLRSASILASVPQVTGGSYDERLESFKVSRGQIACVGRFVMNLFPEREKEVYEWWVKSMESLSGKGGKAVQIFGRKWIATNLVKYADGMLISVEVTRAKS